MVVTVPEARRYDRDLLVQAAPAPSQHWFRTYNEALERVVYVHFETGNEVSTHAETVAADHAQVVADALAAAPEPLAGRGWYKQWDSDESMVVYVNRILHCTVRAVGCHLRPRGCLCCLRSLFPSSVCSVLL